MFKTSTSLARGLNLHRFAAARALLPTLVVQGSPGKSPRPTAPRPSPRGRCTMAPKQATLGYVKPKQTTLGCVLRQSSCCAG